MSRVRNISESIAPKEVAKANQGRVRYHVAAAFLGVEVGTLRAMVHRRTVPHIRLGRRLVVFDLVALANYLEDRQVGVLEGAL